MRIFTAEIRDLSTYRTQLMGIATVMIIMCHAPASGVVMPKFLARVCDQGNYGVDIFLLLSGLGVYYSLNKQPKRTSWGGASYYKRRLSRIFIPYLMIYIPYCIFMMLMGKYTIGDSLLCLSTLEYWVSHRGAWFVSLILVLYLLSPLLFRLLESKSKWLHVTIIIAVIMTICNWPGVEASGSGFMRNVCFALGRVPSFVLGMAAGQACLRDKKITAAWCILPVVLYVVCVKIFSIYEGLAWMLMPLMTYLLVWFLRLIKNISWCVCAFNFLGKISLESYLTNITINSILMTLIPAFIVSPLFYGRWLEYSIVIAGGLMVAFYVNEVSSKLQIK